MSLEKETENESPLINRIMNDNGDKNLEINGRSIDRPLSAPPTVTLNPFLKQNLVRKKNLFKINKEKKKFERKFLTTQLIGFLFFK